MSKTHHPKTQQPPLSEDSGSESGGDSGTEMATGVLSDGTRFAMPETVDVLHSLWHLQSLLAPLNQLWLLTCIATLATYFLWRSESVGTTFFVVQFLFWRLAYNVGIGGILHAQSKFGWFTRLYTKHVRSSRFLSTLLRKSVVFAPGTPVKYSEEEFPHAFSAWMLYRVVVNVILANDLLAYLVLVVVHWETVDISSPLDILRNILGVSLIVFAVWSKADAHRIIGDYAWYWGDFFFLLDKNLIFDGIFEMFPHPMYTVGYFFMYGFTLLTKSYTVFYCSVIGHLLQLIFLTFVENPHIDKTYNAIREPTAEEKQRDELLYDDEAGFLDRRELIVLKNFNFFRASDLILALLLVYVGAIGLLSVRVGAWIVLAQYVMWRLLLLLGLGSILRWQARQQFWTKLFKSPREAFDNWKRLYNTVITVTNFSFLVAAVRYFQWESPLIGGSNEARIASVVVGFLGVSINVYVALGVHEVIGDFGFFYGDFFITHLPTRLSYSGIFRYLNNPDSSLGFIGYYGLAIASGSLEVLLVGIFSHACAKLFEVLVETPHVKQLYGASRRKQGGLRNAIKIKAARWKDALKSKQQEAKEDYERTVQRLKDELAKKKAQYEAFVDRVAKTSAKPSTTAKGAAKPASGSRPE